MNDLVKVYKDEAGEWRWRRTASNGEIIADSGEGYVNKSDAYDMALRVNAGKEEVQFELEGEG